MPVASHYDCVIMVGDLNYRVNGDTAQILTDISQGVYDDLLKNDQLHLNKHLFKGFDEG